VGAFGFGERDAVRGVQRGINAAGAVAAGEGAAGSAFPSQQAADGLRPVELAPFQAATAEASTDLALRDGDNHNKDENRERAARPSGESEHVDRGYNVQKNKGRSGGHPRQDARIGERERDHGHE
ncbi:MAG: hypothetical protein NTZ05_08870, partial [Chloroflexi bacterium]|nr:hypothetical protein [Chloroflexota bacterium]